MKWVVSLTIFSEMKPSYRHYNYSTDSVGGGGGQGIDFTDIRHSALRQMKEGDYYPKLTPPFIPVKVVMKEDEFDDVPLSFDIHETLHETRHTKLDDALDFCLAKIKHFFSMKKVENDPTKDNVGTGKKSSGDDPQQNSTAIG